MKRAAAGLRRADRRQRGHRHRRRAVPAAHRPRSNRASARSPRSASPRRCWAPSRSCRRSSLVFGSTRASFLAARPRPALSSRRGPRARRHPVEPDPADGPVCGRGSPGSSAARPARCGSSRRSRWRRCGVPAHAQRVRDQPGRHLPHRRRRGRRPGGAGRALPRRLRPARDRDRRRGRRRRVTAAAEGVDGVASVTPVHRRRRRERRWHRPTARADRGRRARASRRRDDRPRPTPRPPSTPSRHLRTAVHEVSPTARRRRRRRRDAGHQPRQRAGPARDRPGRAAGHRRDPDVPAAVGRRRRCCCSPPTCSRSPPRSACPALVFNHVFGFAGADPVVPLFAFVFLVALGVDYSIFLMTRVREEPLQRRDAARAAARARRDRRRDHVGGRGAGRDVRGAGVCRCCSSRRSRSSSRSACCSTRSWSAALLVPALVHDLGRRTWWPSALSRHHEHGLHKVSPT